MGNQDVADFIREVLNPILREGHGPAVLVIDHLQKKGAETTRGSIGAVSKLNLVYVSFRIDMIRPPVPGKQAGIARLKVDKDKGGAVRARSGELFGKADKDNLRQHTGLVIVHSNTERTRLDVALLPPKWDTSITKTQRPTHIMDQVSGWFSLQGTGGRFSKKQIEDALPFKSQHVRKAIHVLIDDGHVGYDHEQKRGGASLLYLMKPYFEADDPAARGDQVAGELARALRVHAQFEAAERVEKV
jgi:hypothetical protein